MLEEKIRSLIIILLIFICNCLSAQDFNQTIIDEKSGKSILIGYCNREAFNDSSFSWWFESNYNNYSPDTTVLRKIENLIQSYDIITIIGTWCSDTRRDIPKLMKILDSIAFDYNKLTMISVGRNMKDITDKASELKVELVPTIIFLKNGVEKGRIVESPESLIEEDIYQIIKNGDKI